MNKWILKNYRIILLIPALGMIGFSAYYQIILDYVPLFLMIPILFLSAFINITDFILVDKVSSSENDFKFGLRIWYGPHMIFATILGLLFIIGDIFTNNDGKYILGLNFILGCLCIFQSLFSIKNHYITLTKKHINVSGLDSWRYSKIDKFELDEDKVLLSVNGVVKYIYLNKIEKEKQQIFIDNLISKLPHEITRPNNIS